MVFGGGNRGESFRKKNTCQSSRCIRASQALGYVFLLLYFFNYTNKSFKGSMPANDDFKSDWQGREMGMGGGSRYVTS